jgi:crotonobetainyl-CoA:carnitine CoA-transferase CaiB-like acyl-CoA transferase
MTSPPEPGDREPDDGEPGDPLAGYRVLDLTTFLSGPLVTRSLADLGAEIIKIEPPSGDPTRGGATDGSGAFWWLLHRDRKSVVLDLKSDAGRQVLLSLAGEADVLLENFRPGVMDRLQLSPKQVRAIHPRLVYCTITGFGTDGPAADQTAIDGPVQAFAGMVELSTLHGLPSFPVPIPVADIAGSSAASQAILAALLARHRTGTGCHIDVSLFEAML